MIKHVATKEGTKMSSALLPAIVEVGSAFATKESKLLESLAISSSYRTTREETPTRRSRKSLNFLVVHEVQIC